VEEVSSSVTSISTAICHIPLKHLVFYMRNGYYLVHIIRVLGVSQELNKFLTTFEYIYRSALVFNTQLTKHFKCLFIIYSSRMHKFVHDIAFNQKGILNSTQYTTHTGFFKPALLPSVFYMHLYF